MTAALRSAAARQGGSHAARGRLPRRTRVRHSGWRGALPSAPTASNVGTAGTAYALVLCWEANASRSADAGPIACALRQVCSQLPPAPALSALADASVTAMAAADARLAQLQRMDGVLAAYEAAGATDALSEVPADLSEALAVFTDSSRFECAVPIHPNPYVPQAARAIATATLSRRA